MKRLAVLPLILLLLLATVVPAAADPPQTWYEVDESVDFLVVDCVAYGYDFEVWDHEVYHASEVGYFDHAGNLIRTLVQTQGTDHLYKSNALGVFVASGAFKYSAAIEDPATTSRSQDPNTQTLAKVRFTGTPWNVLYLPPAIWRRDPTARVQEVSIYQGEPPDNTWIAPRPSGWA